MIKYIVLFLFSLLVIVSCNKETILMPTNCYSQFYQQMTGTFITKYEPYHGDWKAEFKKDSTFTFTALGSSENFKAKGKWVLSDSTLYLNTFELSSVGCFSRENDIMNFDSNNILFKFKLIEITDSSFTGSNEQRVKSKRLYFKGVIEK